MQRSSCHKQHCNNRTFGTLRQCPSLHKAPHNVRPCRSAERCRVCSSIATPLAPKDTYAPGVEQLLTLVREQPQNRSGWARKTLLEIANKVRKDEQFVGSFIAAGGIETVMDLLASRCLAFNAYYVLAALLDSPVVRGRMLELGVVEELTGLLDSPATQPVKEDTCRVLGNLVQKDLANDTRPTAKGEGVGERIVKLQGHRFMVRFVAQGDTGLRTESVRTLGLLACCGDEFRELLLDEGLLQLLLERLRRLQPAPRLSSGGVAQRACGVAVANLSAVRSAELKERVLSAGVVGPLLQLQALGAAHSVREAASAALQGLAAGDAEVKQQIISTAVQHPTKSTPAQWQHWWADVTSCYSLHQV